MKGEKRDGAEDTPAQPETSGRRRSLRRKERTLMAEMELGRYPTVQQVIDPGVGAGRNSCRSGALTPSGTAWRLRNCRSLQRQTRQRASDRTSKEVLVRRESPSSAAERQRCLDWFPGQAS